MRFVALALLFVASTASARLPVPLEYWDEEAALTLARSLVGEADFRKRDHEAIAWVYAKRFALCRRTKRVLPACESFSTFVRAYSAPLRVKNPRALAVQALPWGDPLEGRYRKYRDSWRKLLEWVLTWGKGGIPDPCPAAIHFGGTMDVQKYGWEVVDCKGTANTFYRPVRTRRGE